MSTSPPPSLSTTTPPSSYFELLPTEILRSILTHCPSSTTLSLIQTNSAIHERVEPLLYEHITWNVEHTHNKPTLPLLLMTLLARPREVSHRVRSFALLGRLDQATKISFFRHEIHELLDRISTDHPNLFDRHEIEECVFSPSSLLLVSLLLLLCPNITSLTPWSGYDQPPARLAFLSRAMSTLPHLQKLEYATAYTKFPSLTLSDQSIISLFQIPSLRSLTIQVVDNLKAEFTHTVIPYAPKITTLHLHNTDLHCSTLAEVFKSIPNLRVFTLNLLRETGVTFGGDSTTEDTFIDCTELGDSLSSLGNTLESLTITVEFYVSREKHRTLGGAYSSGRDGNPGTLRSWGTKGTLADALRGLGKLRYLEVDPAMVLGWHAESGRDIGLREVLPNGLENLKLRADFVACKDWRGRSAPWVRDLMRGYLDSCTCGAGVSGLKGLTLMLLESHAERYLDSVAELRTLCAEKGMLFGVEKMIG